MVTANEKLTRRERQVMDVVYALGKATVNDVRERLQEPLSYSAARAVLNRLLSKNELKFEADGPRYVYLPATNLVKVRKTAFQKLKDTFFGGSSLQTMTALLGESADELSAEELDALESLVAEAKRKKLKE